MFDLSSDIINPSALEMLDNNNDSNYYNNFLNYENNPEDNFYDQSFSNNYRNFNAIPNTYNGFSYLQDQNPMASSQQTLSSIHSSPQLQTGSSQLHSPVNYQSPINNVQQVFQYSPVIDSSPSNQGSYQTPNYQSQPFQQPNQSSLMNLSSGNFYGLNNYDTPMDTGYGTINSFDQQIQSQSQSQPQQQQQQHQPQPQPQPQQPYMQNPSMTSVKPSTPTSSSPSSSKSHFNKRESDNKIITTANNHLYKIVRGIAAGGSTAKPPKKSVNNNNAYLPLDLNIIGGTIEDVCKPEWSLSEKEDKRRIIRIERLQKEEKLYVKFSILGSADENPTPLPPPSSSNIDVIEVSCLECPTTLTEEIEESNSEDSGCDFDYYITSVEVIELVELLIGKLSDDPIERRKERGRVRSNLVPFWSKKPISSRIDNNQQVVNPDQRYELAKRIMGYEIRKPRGFDKEVRILRWDKLIPALKRALQSYYVEIPKDLSDIM